MSVTRRELLTYLPKALVIAPALAACSPTRQETPTPLTTIAAKPTTAPTIAPTALPTVEALDEKILAEIRREMFRLDRYPQSLRQGIVNFWLSGITGTVAYTKDNESYLLTFSPAQPNLQLKAQAETNLSLERRNLSTGGSAEVFVLNGTYNPALEAGLPEPAKTQMRTMNFEHEAIISIAFINGLARTGTMFGLSFKHPSEVDPQENQKRTQINRYKPTINSYAEAVAEINDYILTYSLFDKDPQGQVLFGSHTSSKYPLPFINGKVFLEGGLTFIVDQNIGRALKGITNLDQLAQKYPSLVDVPGSTEYLKLVQQLFQS